MSRNPKALRFRHRIKDLMIVNAVLATILALGMALNQSLSKKKIPVARVLYTGLVILPTLALVTVGPLALVEVYLYRRKKGAWYRLKNPIEPRPQYRRPPDLPPVDPRMPVPAFLEDEPDRPRSRTRLFEASSSSEPVSRASLLLTLAGRFEDAGRMEAAAKVYRQILDCFADAAEAQDAACRLRRLAAKKEPTPDR
jgi:hypothetical protein